MEVDEEGTPTAAGYIYLKSGRLDKPGRRPRAKLEDKRPSREGAAPNAAVISHLARWGGPRDTSETPQLPGDQEGAPSQRRGGTLRGTLLGALLGSLITFAAVRLSEPERAAPRPRLATPPTLAAVATAAPPP